MRFDTQLAGLEDAPAHARRLEAIGVDGAFTFEGPHDVFTPLILAAGASSTLELATNVAIAFPRNPVQLAHQAWDLQLLSRGRFTLGLGSQIRAQVEKRYGASFDRPVARMRELVGALRAIFASWETGERLDFRGEFTSHTLMPPMFNPGPHPHGLPPIALGGLGPQMVSLAAEVADGLLVMPFNTAAHFRARTLPAVSEGLARAGRDRSDLTVSGEVIVCCGRDEAELETARLAGRWLLSFYASTPAYRPVLEVEGWEDLQPELNALTKAGRWDEMPGRIDDTMLSTLAAVGSPTEVAADIVARFGGLADRVGFYTPYLVADDTLGELVDALRHADRPGAHDVRSDDEGMTMSEPTSVTYDEFSLFHENAEEAGLPFDRPPVVRREAREVGPGRRLSALVWGEGPPELVLLHGGGQNAHTWDTVALALGLPLLAVDLPGHGHSDWPTDSAWLDPASMADDVAVVIAELAPHARAVVGMSLGGATAIALATRHPDLVPRLLLVDITPGVTGDKTSDIAAFLSGPETFATFDEILDRTIQFNPTRSVSSLRRGVLHNSVQLPDGTWTWRHQLGRPAMEPGLHIERADNLMQWDALERIGVPVLLVRGSRSPVVDDADEAEFRRRRPTDTVIVVEDAGHSIQGDQPLELARIIGEFAGPG